MSVDAVTGELTEPAPLHCYGHPDRETYVRCGRCEQPICTRCAMQGPVGFRCRTCGKPAYDPLTNMTPRQMLLGGSVALIGGVVGGYIAFQLGWLSIVLGYFVGGAIAEVVTRFTGYKRGPWMAGILVVGIVGGLLIAGALQYSLWSDWIADPEFGMTFFVQTIVSAGLVYLAAALFGAYSRLR